MEGPFFVPTIVVTVISAQGKRENVTLTAKDSKRIVFEALVNFKPGQPVTLEYGHGFFAPQKSFPGN